ncbi:hypothetical protein [Halorubrum aquaticum]|uniref:hypothetical protein n=1 Tax=Halorubrum aquaticum TaxID=387340 RepID=UPI00122D3877|nr:hypothetical protein [Halorubrum aquaticum]
MSVDLPSEIVSRYRRFSRFNSPYPAHDAGHAIDLYPSDGDGISPVSGVVRETHTVGCPNRPYAASEDHLIVVELDEEWCRRAGAAPGTVARVLHVIPTVEPGDRVAVGDSLGPTTRSGFFGRWVDDHVHLGFRSSGTNALRASGSLPVGVDVNVASVPWDGTGTVIECGPSHVTLDAPTHPDPGERFAAIASDDGVPIDGGLAHYAGGGAFATLDAGETVSLWGTRVGIARDRGIEWEPIDVTANGERVTGLSLFAARDGDYGAKIVTPDHDLAVGDVVSVGVEPSDDPIRLGVG